MLAEPSMFSALFKSSAQFVQEGPVAIVHNPFSTSDLSEAELENAFVSYWLSLEIIMTNTDIEGRIL